MPELSTHEKFMLGEPLNAELEALREGREAKVVAMPSAREREARTGVERPLTRAERLERKEWMEMPGWELFQRLNEKAILMHRKCAIAKSEDDPLENRDAVAAEWAYVKIFRRAIAEMEAIVAAEVAELEKQT